MLINSYNFGGVFTPLSLSPYQWLKADAYSGSDGDQVSTWSDSSGNARDVSGVGTTKPVYKTSIVNGQPVVRFNGTTSYFTLGDYSELTEGEVFIVLKAVSDPATTGEGALWRIGTVAAGSFYPYTNSLIYEAFGSTTRPMEGINPTPDLSSVFRLYNLFSKTNDWGANLDTASLFTTATNTVGFSATAWLGRTFGTSDNIFYGDIAEYILFNRKLTSGERLQMTTYVDNKYNLSY